MFIALVLIMVLFQVITDGILLRPLNITNLVMQNSYVLILAIGMVLIIIAGHIDLSVGSVVAFIGAISAVLSIHMHLPTIVVFVMHWCLAGILGCLRKNSGIYCDVSWNARFSGPDDADS